MESEEQGLRLSEEDERLLEEKIRQLRREGISLAKVNRWNGQPHEHKREIARRAKQRQRQQRKEWANEANTGCLPGHGCQAHVKIP